MGYIVGGFWTETLAEDSSHYILTEVKEESKKEETIEIPSSREVSLNDFDFHLQGFVSNELWNKSFNLQARIIKILKDRVTCECVIDRENKVFETRSFPILLFEHIQKKQKDYPIIISIKTRPGSTRIDIRDGRNIVDLSIFNIKDGWKELINSGLDKPWSLINDSSNI